MRARAKQGSVVLNRRSKTWHFQWYANGQRRSKLLGSARDISTKAAAWRLAEPLRANMQQTVNTVTVEQLIGRYRAEKMPERYSTRRAYDSWLNSRVLPEWGKRSITELQARPVELWLQSLKLSPKSLVEIRGLIGRLWDFAMWCGDVPTQRNPMELVAVKNASKRTTEPRSLTVEEFQKFIRHLPEPFHTVALVCVCFGLRISECLGLKWSDVDWLQGKLHVQRGVVRQRVGDLKTIYSEKKMPIDAGMLDVLKAWKQTTQFSASEDWMFASPAKIGRQPLGLDPAGIDYNELNLLFGTNSDSGFANRFAQQQPGRYRVLREVARAKKLI